MPHSTPNSPADFSEIIETCRKFVKQAVQLRTLAEQKYNEILPVCEDGIARDYINQLQTDMFLLTFNSNRSVN